MTRMFFALSLIVSLASPAAAAPLTIDNFEEGPFNLVDNVSTSGSTLAEQSGLSPSSTIGGVRLVSANASGTSGLTATANLLSTPGDDGVSMVALASGVFTYFYDGIADLTPQTTNGALNLDLTGFDRFLVDMTTVIGTAVQLRITLFDSNSTHLGAVHGVTAGINTFLMSEFGSVDLTDIQTIRLAFSGVSPTNQVVMSNIVAIPEPGTALLLGAGLVGLAAQRRSRR